MEGFCTDVHQWGPGNSQWFSVLSKAPATQDSPKRGWLNTG